MDDYSVLLTPWGNWVNGSANYLVTPVDLESPGPDPYHPCHQDILVFPSG